MIMLIQNIKCDFLRSAYKKKKPFTYLNFMTATSNLNEQMLIHVRLYSCFSVRAVTFCTAQCELVIAPLCP